MLGCFGGCLGAGAGVGMGAAACACACACGDTGTATGWATGWVRGSAKMGAASTGGAACGIGAGGAAICGTIICGTVGANAVGGGTAGGGTVGCPAADCGASMRGAAGSGAPRLGTNCAATTGRAASAFSWVCRGTAAVGGASGAMACALLRGNTTVSAGLIWGGAGGGASSACTNGGGAALAGQPATCMGTGGKGANGAIGAGVPAADARGAAALRNLATVREKFARYWGGLFGLGQARLWGHFLGQAQEWWPVMAARAWARAQGQAAFAGHRRRWAPLKGANRAVARPWQRATGLHYWGLRPRRGPRVGAAHIGCNRHPPSARRPIAPAHHQYQYQPQC